MIYTFFYDNLQVYKCIQSTIKCCQRFNLWSFTLKNEIFVIVLELQTATNLAGPFLNFIEPGFVHEKPNFELALPEMEKSKQTTHHPNPPKIQNFQPTSWVWPSTNLKLHNSLFLSRYHIYFLISPKKISQQFIICDHFVMKWNSK